MDPRVEVSTGDDAGNGRRRFKLHLSARIGSFSMLWQNRNDYRRKEIHVYAPNRLNVSVWRRKTANHFIKNVLINAFCTYTEPQKILSSTQ